MTNRRVVYQGTSDQRILDANDLKKAGVDGFTKTTFYKGIPQEVPGPVADALLKNENKLFGPDNDFEDVGEMVSVADETDESNSGETQIVSESTPNTGGNATNAGGTVGNGSSTRGSTSRTR